MFFLSFIHGTDILRKTGPCYIITGMTSGRVWDCVDTRLRGGGEDFVGYSCGRVWLALVTEVAWCINKLGRSDTTLCHV